MQGIIEMLDETGFNKYTVELFLLKNYLVIQQQSFLDKPIYSKIAIEDIVEVNISRENNLPKLTFVTKSNLVHITENGTICVREITQFILQGYMDTTKQSA